jgi:1-deoxy-D-xylulose-5-phosphate synthase
MTVLCPASFAELRAMLRRALFEMTGPVAIRYPRGGEGAFTADTSAGDFAELRTGKDITLCAYGTLINNVLGAAELLHEDGIEARVVKLNRISPFRGGELSRIFGTTKRLLVAEECSGVGCIGQRIAAILAEEGHEPQRLMLCNLGRRFIEQGSVGELYRQCGLDAESLARTAKEVCQ